MRREGLWLEGRVLRLEWEDGGRPSKRKLGARPASGGSRSSDFALKSTDCKVRSINLGCLRQAPQSHLNCLKSAVLRARKRHINFEHINFLEPWGNPPVNQREKFISPVFRGEHIIVLARLTLGQPAFCPRAIWTLTRAKSLCLCAFLLPEFWEIQMHLLGAFQMTCASFGAGQTGSDAR